MDVDKAIDEGLGAPEEGKHRLQTKNLTEGEREDLRKQGYDIDGEDFVDIELEDPAPSVDPRAEAREQAVKDLTSIVKPQGSVEVEDGPVEDQSEKVKELEAENEELRKALAKIPGHCPRCEWPTGEKMEFEPTKADVKDFLRSVMAGEAFEKKYSLFNGQASVVFRTRTGREEAQIKECIRRLMKEQEITTQADLISRSRRYNFACSVKAYITVHAKMEFGSAEELLSEEGPVAGAVIDGAIDKRIERLPSHLLVILMRMFDQFSALVDALGARVEDPGFWQGIES